MVKLAGDESTWVVDSGASFHLTPKKECFSSYTTSDYDYVKMGKKHACKMVGIHRKCMVVDIDKL